MHHLDLTEVEIMDLSLCHCMAICFSRLRVDWHQAALQLLGVAITAQAKCTDNTFKAIIDAPFTLPSLVSPKPIKRVLTYLNSEIVF